MHHMEITSSGYGCRQTTRSAPAARGVRSSESFRRCRRGMLCLVMPLFFGFALAVLAAAAAVDLAVFGSVALVAACGLGLWDLIGSEGACHGDPLRRIGNR